MSKKAVKHYCRFSYHKGSMVELVDTAESIMKVYGPYFRKDGRQHVIIYENKKRTTISYSKYLLEQKLGRKLLPNETCDHIDGDFSNNSLENLQVLSRADNVRKHAALKPEEFGVFTCPICYSSFTREMRYVKHNLKQGKSGPYCSRKCARVAQRQ